MSAQSDRLATVALGAGALVMVGLSLVGLFAPTQLVGPLGISLSGASAFNEIRAGYGTHLVLAGLFALGVARGELRGVALGVMAGEFAALVSLRLLSFALDGLPGPAVYKPMTLELLLLLLSGAAVLRRRARASAAAPAVA